MSNPTNWDIGWALIRERLRVWVYRPCTAADDLSDLTSALAYAGHSAEAAERLAAFAGRQTARERLRLLRQRIGGVVGAVEAVQGTCRDLGDIEKIRSAVQELTQIGNVANDPTRAAHAFGLLFSGLGDLCRHLPAPADAYAEWMAQSGDFFTNMQSQMGPHRSDPESNRYLNNSYAHP